ncbi:hypothetical protein ABW21_db0205136 [Orbilia brochopaga]|nr:hypothetical protein ABW21_db0205136 [Drechslerella brochopaga]
MWLSHKLPPGQTSSARKLVTRAPQATLSARVAPYFTTISLQHYRPADDPLQLRTNHYITANRFRVARESPQVTRLPRPAGQAGRWNVHTVDNITLLGSPTYTNTSRSSQIRTTSTGTACVATTSSSAATPTDWDLDCYKIQKNIRPGGPPLSGDDGSWFDLDRLQNFTSALAKESNFVIARDELLVGGAARSRIFGIKAVIGGCFYFIHDQWMDVMAQFCLTDPDESDALGTKLRAGAAALPPTTSIIKRLNELYLQLATYGDNCRWKNRAVFDVCVQEPYGWYVNQSSLTWTNGRVVMPGVNMRVRGGGNKFMETYMVMGLTANRGNPNQLADPWMIKDATVTVVPPADWKGPAWGSDELGRKCQTATKSSALLDAFTAGLGFLIEDILDMTGKFFSQTEPDDCLRHFCGSRSGLKVSICGFKQFSRYRMTERDTAVIIHRVMLSLLVQQGKLNSGDDGKIDSPPSFPPSIDMLACALNLAQADSATTDQAGLLFGFTISTSVTRGATDTWTKDGSGNSMTEPRVLKISSDKCTQWEGHCSVQPGDTTRGPTLSGIESTRNFIALSKIQAKFTPPYSEGYCQLHFCDKESGTQISVCADSTVKDGLLKHYPPLGEINERISVLQTLFTSGTSDQLGVCQWDTRSVLGDQTAGYSGKIGQWSFDRTNGMRIPPDYWVMIRKGVCDGYSGQPSLLS